MLEELDAALTTQKKLHAISDFASQNPHRMYNKDEVRSLLSERWHGASLT